MVKEILKSGGEVQKISIIILYTLSQQPGILLWSWTASLSIVQPNSIAPFAYWLPSALPPLHSFQDVAKFAKNASKWRQNMMNSFFHVPWYGDLFPSGQLMASLHKQFQVWNSLWPTEEKLWSCPAPTPDLSLLPLVPMASAHHLLPPSSLFLPGNMKISKQIGMEP